MHAVIETQAFLAAAKDAGISDEERNAIIEAIAANPLLGVPIAGGARKARLAGRGKGEKANLTKREQNDLAALTNRLRETYHC